MFIQLDVKWLLGLSRGPERYISCGPTLADVSQDFVTRDVAREGL